MDIGGEMAPAFELGADGQMIPLFDEEELWYLNIKSILLRF